MNVKNRKMIAAIALTFAAGILMSRADTHYVSLQGTNDVANGYITWAGAATQIQWAVDAAQATTDGDTVLVSNGTYNLTNQINILSNITVQSVNGTNFTFVNGNYPDYTNRCVYMSAGTLDGFTVSNGFLTNYTDGGVNGGAGIVIRVGGVTVKNCYIYKNYITNACGGGIYVRSATGVIISNCAIVGNTCTLKYYGGGIDLYAATAGSLLIDSYISGNTGGYGGGVANRNGTSLITNCTIAGNTATETGGGVRLENCGGVGGVFTNFGYVALANCVISNNSGSSGGPGGVYCYGSTLINCTIIGNRATVVGGVSVSAGNWWGSLMSNCQVIANTASGNYCGGVALYGSAGFANVVANCIIANNVFSVGGYPAGIWLGRGGLVKNCLISCNTNTSSGGGVCLYIGSSEPLFTNFPYGLINCTIVNNQASSGAGIYAKGGTNYIENCIVVSNVTSAGAQVNIYNDTAANTNNYWLTCTPDVLPPNQGNITSDTLFVDRPNRNYRLSAGSPCINTGTNHAWITNSVDLDGRTRIRYVTVDMGAYEFIRSGTIFGFH
ncbi:MAG: hypothetical protein KKD33_01625 [Verrucomicrobia bacterium]|nr:hypothetical protein [Verrucomicrobiota bacterium]